MKLTLTILYKVPLLSIWIALGIFMATDMFWPFAGKISDLGMSGYANNYYFFSSVISFAYLNVIIFLFTAIANAISSIVIFKKTLGILVLPILSLLYHSCLIVFSGAVPIFLHWWDIRISTLIPFVSFSIFLWLVIAVSRLRCPWRH